MTYHDNALAVTPSAAMHVRIAGQRATVTITGARASGMPGLRSRADLEPWVARTQPALDDIASLSSGKGLTLADLEILTEALSD